MIYGPNFSFLSNVVSHQFFTDLIEVCNRNNPSELHISEQVGTLHLNVAEISSSFQQDKKSEITELLTTYDQRRDNAILCLRQTAEAYTKHYKETKRSAGFIILNTINQYGVSIQRYNYQAQTSTIKNLSNDLERKEVSNAIELIGMSDVVKELIEANQLFGNTYMDRVRESIASEQIASSKLMQRAIKNYRKLISQIQAHQTIKPSKAYSQLLKEIRVVVKHYNSQIEGYQYQTHTSAS